MVNIFQNDCIVGLTLFKMVYFAEPVPPHNARASKVLGLHKPHFMVKFQDDRDDLKTYQIRAESRNRKDPHEVTVTTREFSTLVDNLKPGTPYIIYIKTLFRGKESSEIIVDG